MTTAGEINVKLGLNSDSFVKEMDKAEKELKELEDKLKTSENQFNAVAKAMAVTKNPSKELRNAFKQLKDELKQNKSNFDDFNSKLKKLDGGLAQGSNGVNLLQGAFGKLLAGGAILAVTKQIIDFGKQSVAAFREQDRALKSLDTALYNAGVYSDNYASHLKKLSSEIQSYSNYGDEAVQKAMSLGQAYAGNIELTDDLIKATVDYAAATGTDLDTAFNLVGKSIGTSTNALARYGVKLDDSMTKEEKMAVISETLGQRFKGSAENMADSSVQLKNAIGDLSEAIGKGLDPAVQQSERTMTGWIKKMTEAIDKARIVKAEIQELNLTELNARLSANIEAIADLDAKGLNAEEKRNALLNDRLKIVQQIKDLREQDKQKAAESAKNYVAPSSSGGGGTSTGTKQAQDKTLEEYAKYINEYAKLTSNYEATLKARQYVEGTLNIDPVTQQQEYDKMLSLYQQHYAKLTEIAQSGAKNKAEIEKLEEEKLARDLQEIRLNNERDTQRKLQDIIQGYKDTESNISTANFGTTNSFLGGLSAEYKAKLDLEMWYQQERNRIIQESNGNLQLQTDAFAQLDNLKTAKLAQANLSTWEGYGRSVSNIMTNTYTNLITGQESFADAMKNMAQNMLLQLLQMLVQYVMKELAIRAASMFLGGFGGGASNAGGGGFLSGLFGGGGMMYPVDPMLPTYHSGGVVPGTKEQMAVLKGGERVLNPAQNASYTNEDEGQNGVNNVMVFNIKAWDGKDVINTLKSNANTINQIVAGGIKNNQQGLRTTVQNI